MRRRSGGLAARAASQPGGPRQAGVGGQFRFQSVRPGKYRLYAWEELEPGSDLDPQIAASFQAYSVAVEAGENERKQVSITRIGVDALPAPGPGAK